MFTSFNSLLYIVIVTCFGTKLGVAMAATTVYRYYRTKLKASCGICAALVESGWGLRVHARYHLERGETKEFEGGEYRVHRDITVVGREINLWHDSKWVTANPGPM